MWRETRSEIGRKTWRYSERWNELAHLCFKNREIKVFISRVYHNKAEVKKKKKRKGDNLLGKKKESRQFHEKRKPLLYLFKKEHLRGKREEGPSKKLRGPDW